VEGKRKGKAKLLIIVINMAKEKMYRYFVLAPSRIF